MVPVSYTHLDVYKRQIPMFFLMKELSGILRSRRHTRGSIDFDFPESKIILNAAGKALSLIHI